MYQVNDAESDLCTLLCEYSLDKGTTWHTAAVSGEISNVSSNISRYLNWQVIEDINDGFEDSDVYFRITPKDLDWGGSKTEDSIEVDFNDPPSAQIYAIPGTITSDRPISYALSDSENDPLSIKIYYKLQGDTSWIEATVTGQTENIVGYAGNPQTITWNIMQDVPNTSPDGTTANLKIVPYDWDMGTAGETQQAVKIQTNLLTKMEAFAAFGDSIINIRFNEEMDSSVSIIDKWSISHGIKIKMISGLSIDQATIA